MTLRDSFAACTSTVCRDTWGQGAGGVVYTPTATGVAEEVNGIFDERDIDMVGADDVPFTARYPVLDIRLDDLSTTPKQGDTLTTDGQSFEVDLVRRDGHGNALLILLRTGA